MSNPTTPSNSSTPLRLLQVGIGGWGRSWAAEIVSHLGAVRAVGWVEANDQSLAEAQRTLGLPKEGCFTTFQAALENVHADAVLITAPAVVHATLAIQALEAGLHVLVEKPFAPTLQEASQVVEAARAANRTLMVSQNYRFHPAPQLVARLVREGRLGQVGAVQVDFRRGNVRPSPSSPHLLWPQPLLLDMAIHHFDLMRFILGAEALEMHCRAWNPAWSLYRDPASAVATIDFGQGAVVSYRGSWVSPGPVTPWAGEWRLECEDGEISFVSRGDVGVPDAVRVRRLGKRAQRLELPALAHTDRLGSLNAFVEAVQTGVEPMCSGRDNLHTLGLSLGAIRSAHEERLVRPEVGML